MITECIEHGCSDLTDSVSGRCEWHEAQNQQRLHEIDRHLGCSGFACLEDELAAEGMGLGAC